MTPSPRPPARVAPADEGQQQDQMHYATTEKNQLESRARRDAPVYAANTTTQRKVRQLAMQHPVAVREDWETPPDFFAALDAEFGFTLDVCATPANAKCARFFTTDDGIFDGGLDEPWGGEVCWMNPPYGFGITRWMRKAWEESQGGATVVCLVPARTDTRWWHAYAERASERRFVKGRIRFVGARFNAPFPCVVVVFRHSTSERAA